MAGYSAVKLLLRSILNFSLDVQTADVITCSSSIRQFLAISMGGVSSHETFTSSNADKDGYRYWAKFETEPFEEGVSRFAFHGEYRGSGPLNEAACVTKVFKKEYAKNFDMWVPDLAASTIAKEFADKFNSRLLPRLNINPMRQLDFAIPLIAKTDQLSQFKLLWFIPFGSEDKR